MDLDKLKDDIRIIIRKELDLKHYRAFFFGSRVTGKAKPTSDFDVGILGDSPVSYAIMQKIRERMDDLDTLFTVDIVDFYGTSDQFKKIAMEKIEEIL